MPKENTGAPVDQAFTSRLKTQQLALLEALDQHRSVVRAAQAVNMTQPAASKLLLQLEATLGVPLFRRHPRGMEPTQAGAILIQHAHAAMAELRRAGDEMAALRSGLRGHVALGTEAASAALLVPRAIGALKQAYPLVSVSVELAFSERLVELVLADKLDLAIARVTSKRDQAALHCHTLPRSRHVIAARSGHKLMRHRGLRWHDLIELTWIVPPEGNVMRDSLTLLLQEQGLPFPERVVETAALAVIVGLLEQTDMVAPLPESAIAPFRRVGLLRALPIEFESALDPAAIITARASRPSSSALRMLTILRALAAESPEGDRAELKRREYSSR